MAILEDLGLEVKIVVDGSPLQEYEDKEQEPAKDGFGDEIPKCRCYVEVVEDAEFAVLLRATSSNKYLNTRKKGLLFAIDLDGQDEVENWILISSDLEHLVEGKDEHVGQEATLRRFRFAAVSTVDDDDAERVKKDRNTARHLGLIRVRVWPGEVNESEEPSDEASDSSTPNSPCHTTGLDEMQNEFSEKALKGKSLSHKATLSAAVPRDNVTFLDFDYDDPSEVPIAVFYFKYRSRAMLQDEMVIPRSGEPSPQRFDVDGLALEEIRRLAKESVDDLPFHEVRRLAQVRLSRKEVGNIFSARAVKRESVEEQTSLRPRKIVKMMDGREAVDLTEDD